MPRALLSALLSSLAFVFIVKLFPGFAELDTSSSGLPFESVASQVIHATRTIGNVLVSALIVIAAITLVFTFAFGEPVPSATRLTPEEPAPPDLRTLPRALRNVREWLRGQQLPQAATEIGESISDHLDAIAQALKTHEKEDAKATVDALSKLLADELAELVRRYQRVPRVLRLVPSVGSTATDLLLSGLRTVDARVQNIETSLGDRSVQGLAVQARFLELKYDRVDPLLPDALDPRPK